MVELSQPGNLSEMAVTIGIERGEWGLGKASVQLNIESKHCNKGGVAHGGLYTMMLDMALGGSLVSILPKEEWCATTQLNVSFISAARPGEKRPTRDASHARLRQRAHKHRNTAIRSLNFSMTQLAIVAGAPCEELSFLGERCGV